MIVGGLIGLLIGVIYTLVTGKLQLTKTRVAYGTPARAAALLALAPLMFLFATAMRDGGITNKPGGVMLFLGTLVASIVVIYAVGWPFSEAPREKR